MLTATYSLVAIAAEQDMARGVLQRLRQGIQNMWHGLQKVEFAFLEAAFDKLFQFDYFCHHRKLDLYVIPVLRRVTHEADSLLEQLESLRESGLVVLHTAKERLVATFEVGTLHAHEAVHAMELFLENMRTRLKREEEELFPMLRRLLSVEDWFAIAAQFLEEDCGGYGKGRRHDRAIARRQAVNALGSLSLH